MIGPHAELRFEMKMHGFSKGKLITINTNKRLVEKHALLEK
jgi:hypothetical protein